MTLEYALERVAQLWCLPQNANTVMDTKLCESMAKLLVAEIDHIRGVEAINKPQEKIVDTEPNSKKV